VKKVVYWDINRWTV